MNQEGHKPSNVSAARPSASTKFDLNQVVQQLAYLRQHEHQRQKIEVILDLATELPKTSADGRQIESVLLALFARARNAIVKARKHNGTISIRTALKAGKVQFSITDDGIADPSSGIQTFFTRPLEEDMNLTTCAEIVQDQGGELYTWCPHHPAVTTIVLDLPSEN